VAGRWPGRQGLEFKRVSDRVRVTVPGEYESITMAAWVRVDALSNRFNSLFMTDGWEEGAPHWHIGNNGKIELGVQGGKAKGNYHYLTPEVFTPDRVGDWVHLAVVYDGAEGLITHYMDGRLVTEEVAKFETKLRFGDAELGNWNTGKRTNERSPVRYFNGCIDEFLLFSRPLGAVEVEKLSTQGRPPS
jgi:hypothetical protein